MKDIVFVVSEHHDCVEKNKSFFCFFEEQQYEIHQWIIEDSNNFYPEFPVEALIKMGYTQEDELNIVFVSDNRSIVNFTYRLFNSCFSAFVWIPEEKEKIVFRGIYKQVVDFNSIEKEDIKSKIAVYFQKKNL